MMLFKKEKEVIELIEQHVDKMEACLSTAIDTLEAYLNEDIPNAKKLARQTDALESEARFIDNRAIGGVDNTPTHGGRNRTYM